MKYVYTPNSQGWRLARLMAFVVLAAIVSFLSLPSEPSRAVAPSPFIVSDVNPNVSTVNQPFNGDVGGRVNGLAVNPGNPDVLYAASEFGGIYRTTDGGQNWDRLDGHRPYVAWDVEVDPRPSCSDGVDNGSGDGADFADANECADPNASEDGGLSRIVYATSFYDGNKDSKGGINVSYDGGSTWIHPNVPAPATPCTTSLRLPGDSAGWDEPSAYGISVRRDPYGINHDVGRKVFIGTKCGVAISLDSGGTWTHVDPNPTFPGGRVWDVVVHGPSGVVDVCGDEGHFRSLDDGVTWVDMDASSAIRLPGTTASLHDSCSIVASPLDPDVLFVALEQMLFQTADGGITWTRIASLRSVRLPWLNVSVTDTGPDGDCTTGADSDGDGVINEGCPPVGTEKEDNAQCGNALDDDGDNVVNDGCPASGAPETGANCLHATNDDGDSLVNDGCPAAGTHQPEVVNSCSNSTDDDDLDGKINDGCPAQSRPEAGTFCTGAADGRDDDGDGVIDDGCGGPGDPAADGPEAGADCDDAVDDDKDGFINDGCYLPNGFPNPGVTTTTIRSEGLNDFDGDGTQDFNQCDDNRDNELDGSNIANRINDGCPLRSFDLWVGDGFALFRMPCANTGGPVGQVVCAEVGAQCDGADSDADGFIDDGCPANGTPEPDNQCRNGADDDGDGAVDDGCLAAINFNAGAHNDSGDLEFNPQSPIPQCPLYYANDGGTYWNASCADGPETGAQCTNAVDDDDDNDDGIVGGSGDVINDGCPAVGAPENDCDDNTDNDGDGAVNDGCIWSRIQFGMHGQWLWDIAGASQCEDNVSDDDDNGDGTSGGAGDAVNDGCRQVGATAETGAQCNNNTNDDAGDDSVVNDGCPAVGPSESIDVFTGAQDVGMWVSKDAGQNWANTQCCDVFDIESDPTQTVYTLCCFAPTFNGLIFTSTFPDGTPEVDAQCNNALDDDGDGTANDGCAVQAPNQLPAGNNIRRFQQFDSIDQFGPGDYVIVADTGNVFITRDNFATPPTPLTGAAAPATPPNACGVQASVDPNTNTPTFYVMTVDCDGGVDDDRDGSMNEDQTVDGIDDDGDGQDGEDPGGQIWKYTGTSGGNWTRADTGLTSVGTFAVHPRDPNRLYASELKPTFWEIKQSSNGGGAWGDDNTLEDLLGDDVIIEDFVTSGGLSSTTNGTYVQPTMLEISPHSSAGDTVILAGGMDSGVFVSSDNGASWNKIAVTARCNNGVDEDGDGTADDGCPDSGLAAVGVPEQDEELPRPYDAYFDSSGIFYIGTQGHGIWKVTGLGPSAVNITNSQKDCIISGWGKFLQFLTGLAPQGENVSAHLSDLDQVLRFLKVSLAGNSGLNLGSILNALDPGTAASLQEFVNKLDSHISQGGINGNINGVDVIVDAGFDIVGGEKVTLDVELTLSKVVDAPMDLAAGGDTLGFTIEGDAPVLLTFNASIKFGFSPPDFNPGDPNSCDSNFFIERAGLRFRAQTVLRDRLIEARLGFFKLATKDQFVNNPPEPDEGADIDADASVEVGLIDPNSSCADGSDNGPDGGSDLADADCHTDGNVANGASYDPTLAEDGVANRISLLEAQSTSIVDITRIRPKGHVHADIPIRTNLFDVTAPETACNDNVDDDRDGKVNDGCAADAAAEEGANCENDTDDDGDGKVNDGCPRSNPRIVFDYSLNPGNPSLEFHDMGAVNPFNNLNNINFLTAMRELLQWLQSLQNTGVLDTQLPFADATLGDIVAVADRLTSALEVLVDDAGNPTFGDAEDFQSKFRQALAIALGVPEESLPQIPLEYDHLTRTFTYDLSVSDSFTSGGGEGRTPTCNDGIDNGGGDGADENDSDCLFDDDPNDAIPAHHVKDAYEDGNCGDGIDNDGAEGADAADPHCHMDNDPSKPVVTGRREQNTCTDGHDNDNDGSVDANDPQCKPPLNLAGDFELFEGVNIVTTGTTTLTAGFDLNLKVGMDLRDFPEIPTEGPGAAEDSCRDGTDNDSDGQIDALDPDCGPREAGGGAGSCTDGQDNNNDTLKDAQAPECTLVEGSGGGAGSCYDGVDNDNDLLEDLKDGDCTLTLEDRLFIVTDETNHELKLDLQLNATNVTANAVIGMLEVGVQDADLVIGASEDPTATCGDGVDNGDADGHDTNDPDCHTDSDETNGASYSAALEEDGVSNADCNDGVDNDNDGITVTGGLLDIVPGGNAADDDGSLLGFQIIDGQVDIDHSGAITEEDDGAIAGEDVIDGKVDLDGNGTADDNGSLVLMDENDPDCHVLVVDLTNPDGRLTLPELLQSINNISSLVSADINAFADASLTVGASINGAPIGAGTITANGGVTGPIIVNGSEDGGAADTCTDGIDNGGGDEDGDGEDDIDGGDPDCSPLVANLKIDTSGLGDLLDFNTDDPLALLIRLLEIIDGVAEQMKGQENGILGEPIPLVGVSTVEILSYAGELADLLEGVRMNPEGNIVCANQEDEDGDGTPNDGCPGVVPVGEPETNKPCEAGNNTDDDADGTINDGCPAQGPAEGNGDNHAGCTNAIDDDGDGFINDGCPTAVPTLRLVENQIEKLLGLLGESDGSASGGANCANDSDDDGDSLVNEGCPADGAAETGNDCLNDADDDGDTKTNDGCPDNLYIEYLNGEDLIFHLKFGKTASAQGSLDFDLSSLGVDPELIGLITSGQLDATIAGRLDLDFGITIGGSDLSQITPFILDTSGITMSASVDATNFQVQGNVGPLTVLAGNIAETGCGAAVDEDNDGFFNEGCAPNGAAEAGPDCLNSGDDDGDGEVNDGCPADPASLHLGGEFAVNVTGGDAEGKIPLSSIGAGNFSISLTGNNDPDCTVPVGTAGACAQFKTYIGTQELCEILVYVPDLASPTFELDDPGTVGKQNPSCDFAGAIANAALDMLLLESGLGDLLNMFEKLLNGDLFGFKIPLVGNLGFGTDFIGRLRSGLVEAITTGDATNASHAFENALGGATQTAVMQFRDAVANFLMDPDGNAGTDDGLLMDRNGDGNATVDDLKFIIICNSDTSAPRACGYGDAADETDCADTVDSQADPLDDDGDGKINDGCPVNDAGTAETDCAAGETAPLDDDSDGVVNDGCPAVGTPETGEQCANNVDDDDDDGVDGAGSAGDTINDGCPVALESVSESDGSPDGGPNCANNTDDEDNYPETAAVEKDGLINDGCPRKEPDGFQIQEIRFFGTIGQQAGANPDIGFDLGLPGLGLTSTGAIEMGFGWELNLGFGVSKNQGFFLIVEPMEDGLTSASCSDEDPPGTPKDNDGDGLANEADPDCEPNELIIGAGVNLDGVEVKAKIAFLQATIADKHAGDDATAQFTINLVDPGTSENDGRLEFAELIDAPAFDEVVKFDLAAKVDLSLGITTATDFNNDGQDDPAIPKLLADLNMDWRWSLGDPADPDSGETDPGALDDNVGTECNDNPADDATEDCFSITFDNLRLDVGTFLASTVGPVAAEIQKYTKPLQPAIDALTAPIPVISELAGEPVTLLDLVILLGEGDLDFLDDIVAVIEFINSFDASGAAGLVIPLGSPDNPADPNDGGDYDLNGSKLLKPLGQAVDAFDSPSELDQVNNINALQKIQDGEVKQSNGNAPTPQQTGLLASLKKLTEEAGVSFPFLEKPADTVQLLFGKDVTLVLWEPPNLKASFAYSQSFGPVWAVPPVFVHIGGSVTLQGHFGLGMDTEGIRALSSGEQAPSLLKGLFLADYDKNGQEVPEFSMRGELFAGASISVLIFEAGAEGGVFLTINIDLNDPNNDGKMKFAEIQDIILTTGNPLCIFTLEGEFGAFLRVFVEVDLFFWSQRWSYTLAEITLLSFNVECDLDPVPNLATRVGNTLWLNMGDTTGYDGDIGTENRRNAFLSTDDEEYTLIKNPTTGLIEVKAFGFIECDFNDDGECTVEGDGGITLVMAMGGSGDDKISAVPNANQAEDGLQTCGDGVDNSDVSNGDPTGNGDGGADQTDDDCHTDGDATDGDDTYRADLAEDGIEACSDGVDNGNDGKADRGTKSNAVDPNLPPDPDCSGDPVPFDIAVDFDGGSGEDSLVSDTANDKLKGGADKDSIQSGLGDDDIYGGDGDDEISAGEGNDDIYGDNGDDGTLTWDNCGADAPEGGSDGGDYIDAGLGADRVCGQGGNDNIVGGLSTTSATDGIDTVYGGSGNDTIDGGDGNDMLFGGPNNDNINGGGGDDTIHGGDETTAAFADNLGDNLLGGPGADHIFGEDGDDNIVGGAGADPELRGGNHDDVLLGDDGQVERVAGSTPEDRLDDIVTLAPGPDEGADNIEGGLGDDWLYGQGGADVLKGDGGETEDGAGAGSCDDGVDNGDNDGADAADANDCEGGDDDLIGGSHNDQLFGGPGIDIMLGDGGSVNHNAAGRSDDSAVLIAGPDEGADQMHGEAGNDKMFGQGGNDLMNGGGGNDRMNGNADVDTMNGNAGMDTMFGGPGDDIMRGNQDADEMHGNSGNDHMIGGSPTAGLPDTGDRMYGEVGIDIMVGDNGTISGTDVDLLNLNPIGGNDYMEGNAGNDDMYGGPGRDEMHGQEGDDYMEGNNDRDFMTGDAGEDDMIGGTSKEALSESGSPPGGGIADGADLMLGGDAVDYMAGDNASIRRPGGDDTRNTYNNAVIRTVELYDVAVAGGPAIPASVSGGDGMSGGAGDDVMYGGGNGGQGVDDDGDGEVDEDPVDDADTDKDGNEDGSAATPPNGTCNNGIDEGDDGKDADDPDCAPFVDEDPGGDVMHGNDGDDYVEGNAGDDTIFGDAGQDDLIGGTGRTNTDDPNTAQDGRLDGGDAIYGGDGNGGVAEDDFDVVAGDNATIDRPLDGDGLWQVNSFNAAVKREIHFYDVGMAAPGSPAAAGTNGNDTIRGENDDDLLYGQGGNDDMQGNDGDDYMEGNDGADSMQGNNGNDDMAGGTGRIFQGNVQDPPEGRDGRLDSGETGMSGGAGFDFMIGDNGVITRVLDSDGAWMPSTFHVCDPLSDCNGVQHNPVVLRDVQLLGVPVGAGTSGGEQNMAGDGQDDIMYGQGGDDEMFGGNGDDYMEGNHDDDDMYGNAGEDDMLGGGSDDSDIPDTTEPDLLDGDDVMRGESDFSDGTADGDDADAMIGDNGKIVRPLGSQGEWQTVPANGVILRAITIFDVEMVGSPLSLSLSGDDDMYGNDNDDTMYGQGGEDDMFGGSGDDYMEGNAHSDTMYGGPDQDDMIGGTARTTSNDPSTFVAGRTDESTKMRSVPLGRNMANVKLGDTMYGGDGADEMGGDNLLITRPLISGQWTVFNYSLQADSVGDVDPRHAASATASSRVDRATQIVDTVPGATAGSDLMFGGNGDDNMFGQYDNTNVLVPAAGLFVEESHECANGVDDDGDGVVDDGCSSEIGDEMYGEAGEDAMAGDQGTFEDRVLPPGSAQTIAPKEPFITDNTYVDGTLFREFHLSEITGFDKTGTNDKGGYDRMKGGDGADWMHGGAGNDLMNGDRGNDRLFGDNGDDTMWGGAHHDHLWGGFDHDHLDVHPVVDEPDSVTCTKPSAPINPATHDPLEQYTFGFADGDTACDGNLEDVDFMYGGWNQDTMEANVGDNGPRIGDRLIDWVGVFNLYILCPGTYGEFVSTREFSPALTEFMHQWAEGDGAFDPGPVERGSTADPSGFNEIAFVYKPDLKSNANPPHEDTPAHFNCSADSTTIP